MAPFIKNLLMNFLNATHLDAPVINTQYSTSGALNSKTMESAITSGQAILSGIASILAPSPIIDQTIEKAKSVYHHVFSDSSGVNGTLRSIQGVSEHIANSEFIDHSIVGGHKIISTALNSTLLTEPFTMIKPAIDWYGLSPPPMLISTLTAGIDLETSTSAILS
ncbi:hypothetical protein MMC25_004058 [Agyrium rufum]|nr:hypothetical protein [Agyrium rufum]